jgi:hypothetical protein
VTAATPEGEAPGDAVAVVCQNPADALSSPPVVMVEDPTQSFTVYVLNLYVRPPLLPSRRDMNRS